MIKQTRPPKDESASGGKSEIRNKFKTLISKFLKPPLFRVSSFEHSNLFRVSSFGFRVCCLCLLFCVSACGVVDLNPPDSLFSRQPRVVYIDPQDGDTVPADSSVVLKFSRPIDTATVNSETLAIVKDDGLCETPDDAVESVSKNQAAGLDGKYEFAGGGRLVTFRPPGNFENSSEYCVVATSRIASVDLIPLGAPVVSSFKIDGKATADERGPQPAGSADDVIGDDSSAESDSSPPETSNRPETLVINEFLYDIVGDDTNGQVFVELLGTPASDVSGYKLVFINGDDGKINGTITFPDSAAVGDDGIYLVADAKTGQTGVSSVVDADLIVNFDPQNGPDCIQLMDNDGLLVDAAGYGTPLASLAENGMACFEGTAAARVTSGQSLSRTEGADTNNNAADFRAVSSPTAGAM